MRRVHRTCGCELKGIIKFARLPEWPCNPRLRRDVSPQLAFHHIREMAYDASPI
jgi:hypothetical protein